MSTVYSREYLQALPEIARKERIENEVEFLYDSIIEGLPAAAIRGETSYSYTIPSPPSQYITTDIEELVRRISLKFPGCGVTHENIWVEQSIYTKLKKIIIVINWSRR